MNVDVNTDLSLINIDVLLPTPHDDVDVQWPAHEELPVKVTVESGTFVQDVTT